jgi:hypothetical protein
MTVGRRSSYRVETAASGGNALGSRGPLTDRLAETCLVMVGATDSERGLGRIAAGVVVP